MTEANTTATKKMVKLVSTDGVEMELPASACQIVKVVQDAIKAAEKDATLVTVQLDRITSRSLGMVVKYLTYYDHTKMVPIPDPTTEMIPQTFVLTVPQKWYRDYMIEMGVDNMWRVRSAAHHMGIEPLTYLTNTWLAFHLMDKDVHQMHEILCIPRMTPEQEAKARFDYPQLFNMLEEDAKEPELEPAPGAKGRIDDDEEDEDYESADDEDEDGDEE
jgi:hypothetical protein